MSYSTKDAMMKNWGLEAAEESELEQEKKEKSEWILR
jgi:hypothetical protein